ncbi:MAG: NAD-dependent epimerase/dehydratase family protein [Candidatus Omnitrophica bacterium]|nr:NAD-dependent epimerase/dehydratase family protein [Candidatus Omnitrophota bacterium]MDD5079300.1 NAD-dependent epimerase/dehydratase family protein [Candidatus Omnitrophota bacterium]
MKILVTGATGFVGQSLVEALNREKHQLYALVRKTSSVDVLKKNNVRLAYGDIAAGEGLKEALGLGFDAIYHCSGLVEDTKLKRLREVNVKGTENICRLALEVKVPRFIYLSSVAVVSGNLDVPLTENLPFKATNNYGISKLEAEKKVIEFRKQGLRAAIIRPSMIYGEGEPHLSGLLMRLLKFRLLPIVDGGNNKLHLAYVKNVAAALVMALHNDAFLEGSFFVADEDVLTVKEIFTTWSKVVAGGPPFLMPRWITPALTAIPGIGKKLSFFLKDRVYDISRIRSLGYKPVLDTRQALIKTAQYWKG